MTEYNLGFAVGQITVGILFLWLGLKGFSQKGIPLTKKYSLKGWIGKIIGLILILWGTLGTVNGILIVYK